MPPADSLTNQLLIAMPSLQDVNFAQTVTYICEHNENGAMGLIINRPTEIQVGEILEQMDMPAEESLSAGQTVLMGGPVQPERGFVLHSPVGHWEATMQVTDSIGVTTSRDVLAAIASNEGPASAIVTLGYAGWAAGQLEQELVNNSWLTTPVTREILFDLPFEQRWEAAAALLGIDLNLLSGEAGHA
jgi:putative transcriptional regulator